MIQNLGANQVPVRCQFRDLFVQPRYKSLIFLDGDVAERLKAAVC
jgi:hypothetical protein